MSLRGREGLFNCAIQAIIISGIIFPVLNVLILSSTKIGASVNAFPFSVLIFVLVYMRTKNGNTFFNGPIFADENMRTFRT